MEREKNKKKIFSSSLSLTLLSPSSTWDLFQPSLTVKILPLKTLASSPQTRTCFPDSIRRPLLHLPLATFIGSFLCSTQRAPHRLALPLVGTGVSRRRGTQNHRAAVKLPGRRALSPTPCSSLPIRVCSLPCALCFFSLPMAASPWCPSSLARRPCSSALPVRAPPGSSSLCPAAVEFPARAPSPSARSRLSSNASELGPCILPAVTSMAPSSDFCLVAHRFLVSWSRPAVFCQGCSYTRVLIPLLAVGPTVSSSPAMSSSMTPSTGVSPSVCCWIPASPSTLTSRRSYVVLVVRQPLNKCVVGLLAEHCIAMAWMPASSIFAFSRCQHSPSASSGSSARCSFTLHASVTSSHVSSPAVNAQKVCMVRTAPMLQRLCSVRRDA
jgi:hypothetical protein